MKRKHWLLAASVSLAVIATMLCGATWAAESGRSQARILVLTGNEYPGHKWQETAPWIAKFLKVDPRLTVDLNTDPAFLTSPELAKYDAIVLNYLNWQSPDPGEKARENLKKFIAGGKGLVLVHNAVAAFGDQRVMRDGKFVRIEQCD